MPKFTTVLAGTIFLATALACGEGDEPEIRGPFVEREGIQRVEEPVIQEREVEVVPQDRIEGDLDGDGVLSEEERTLLEEE